MSIMRKDTSVIVRTLLCAFLLAHLCHAERFYLRRDHVDQEKGDPLDSVEKVQTEADCEIYLCNYGYLNCSCQPRTIDHKLDPPSHQQQQQPVGLFPLVFTELDSSAKAKEEDVLPNCTATDIREAYVRFQRRFQLPASGQCDVDTRKRMNKPRCGNKDLDLLRGGDGIELDHISRMGVTLASVLRPTKATETAAQNAGAHERRKRHAQMEMARADEEMRKSGLTPRVDTAEEIHERKKRRVKRSADKTVYTWRLSQSYLSNQLASDEQRGIFYEAFRRWAEISPLRFTEDRTSDLGTIDVLIVFQTRQHLNCPATFDGPSGVLGHVVQADGQTADIHIDDDESFIAQSGNSELGISLLMVATHEIGHTLGLSHLASENSIMNGEYQYLDLVELTDDDRVEVRRLLGVCKGSFSTVFDWLRFDYTEQTFVYNTYFMRNDHYWMYLNDRQRPRYGDPVPTIPNWQVSGVDAFLQVWDIHTITNFRYYFFSGEEVHVYQHPENAITAVHQISTLWPGMFKNIDSAFFDVRDNTIKIFKGNQFQIWNVATNPYTLVDTKEICAVFPPLNQDPDNTKYCTGIDAAYYSFYTNEMFFFKEQSYWKNQQYNPMGSADANQMSGVESWYLHWFFLCDV